MAMLWLAIMIQAVLFIPLVVILLIVARRDRKKDEERIYKLRHTILGLKDSVLRLQEGARNVTVELYPPQPLFGVGERSLEKLREDFSKLYQYIVFISPLIPDIPVFPLEAFKVEPKFKTGKDVIAENEAKDKTKES